MRVILFLLCVFAMMPRMVFADVRLAVLEFRGIGVSNALLKVLADDVRAGVLDVSKGKKIKGEKLLIMTRENIVQVLKDQGLTPEDCTGECEVEIAKNIGADYVISGDVTKLGSTFVFNVKLHATSDSNLLSTESLKTKSQDQLMSQASTMGAKVFREGLNLKGTSSTSRRQSQSSMNSESDESGDIVSELKEQECQQVAMNKANREREASLQSQIKQVQGTQKTEWDALSKQLTSCSKRESSQRKDCKKKLEQWEAIQRKKTVSYKAQKIAVQTECGTKDIAVQSTTKTVPFDLNQEVKSMKTKLVVDAKTLRSMSDGAMIAMSKRLSICSKQAKHLSDEKRRAFLIPASLWVGIPATIVGYGIMIGDGPDNLYSWGLVLGGCISWGAGLVAVADGKSASKKTINNARESLRSCLAPK